ncbi:hypothetical protein PRELSG_0019200 [Plasmodium relictum]|uniref:Fam-b protein n=1 Tax=Plasmodium relictum TaxID=85471 RepID=A0A1J1GMN9_PLARL|nr:hypothetical protein PRELSG_0019200 [Plasmodium relictum]CRG84152.1 hypothetical protein PRELSG_0019200 [Plasmodium relictum]
MRNSNVCIILLNIAIVLTGISFAENNGTNVNSTGSDLINSSVYLNNNNGREDAIYDSQNSDLGENDILPNTSGNTAFYNLQNVRLGNTQSDILRTDPYLRRHRLNLEVQRRKLINMKKRLDDIYKTLSQRMETFCSVPDKEYSEYKLDELDDKANDVYDVSSDNMMEYNRILIINKEIKKYLEKNHVNSTIHNDKIVPIMQKNAALQYHIKHMINVCLNLINFIHKKKGVNDNIEGFLGRQRNDVNKSEFSLYSVETENDGFFSSTKAKVTLGILGCLLVGGGIAFAFYYKNIMYKN